jgi:preprotein translocase subunit YajC
MFFTDAFAADVMNSVASGPTAMLGSAMPMVLIVAVFYLLIIRPNQKKIKDHEDMIKALRRGDKVVTAGGVIGVIHKVEDDNVLVLEIADNVKVRVIRETISNVMNKTPVANDNKTDNKAESKTSGKSAGGK